MESLWCIRSRLTTKLSDSRRRAPVERRGDFQITRDSQTESAAAVRCSALVRRHLFQSHLVFVKVRTPPIIAPKPTPQARLSAISFVEAPNAAPMAVPLTIQMLIIVPDRQLFVFVVRCSFIIICSLDAA